MIGDLYDNYDFKLLSSGVNLRDKDTSKPIKTYLRSKDSLIEIVFDESLKEIKKGEYLINVKIDKNNLINYNLRNKIIDEIVINNLKGNNVDILIESLVDKFKS